jgi:hypothetical protein
MYRLLILSLLCFSAQMLSAQTLNFDVLLFGDKIGKMAVSRTYKGDTVTYVLNTHSKAKILWMEYEDISHITIVYKGAKLLSCKYTEDMNGKRKYFTNIMYDGKEYHVETKDSKRVFAVPVLPSLFALYYKEPVDYNKIFFESQLFTAAVKMEKIHHYSFDTKDGNKNEYLYRNGEIDKLVFHTPLATVHMSRIW